MLLRRLGIAHVAAISVILLAGCATPNLRVDNSADLRSIRVDPTIPIFPIEAYMFTADQTNNIDKAFSGVARRCMERFGLSYEDAGPSTVTVRPGDRRYGVTDSEWVARYGYHLPPDSPQAVAQARAERYHKPRRPADVLRVLTGQDEGGAISFPVSQSVGRYRGIDIPAGGCLGEARRALDEDGPGSDFSLVDKINLDSFGQSQATSSVRDAIAAWSACMANAGYSYPDPLAVPGAFDLRTNEPGERELRTAQADVNCKSGTRLTDTWLAAEITIQNTAISIHHTELTTIRDRMDRQLRAAGIEAQRK